MNWLKRKRKRYWLLWKGRCKSWNDRKMEIRSHECTDERRMHEWKKWDDGKMETQGSGLLQFFLFHQGRIITLTFIVMGAYFTVGIGHKTQNSKLKTQNFFIRNLFKLKYILLY